MNSRVIFELSNVGSRKMVFRLKTSWKVIKFSAHGNVSSEILKASKHTGKRYSSFFQLPPKSSNFHRLFSEKNVISRVRIIRSVLDALKVAVQFCAAAWVLYEKRYTCGELGSKFRMSMERDVR